MPGSQTRLAGVAFLFRIEEFGKARVFLKEVEVFVVARVKTVGGAKINGNFEIGERGIGFAGKAIEGGERVVDMVSLGGELAGFFEAFAGFIPTAEIHHGDATLVVIFGGLGILFRTRLHTLFGDA
jgi:hypothetical protein